MGPFPGTPALAVPSTGVPGKLYSETLEAAPTQPVEALAAAGASASTGWLPQAMSSFTSLALYQ